MRKIYFLFLLVVVSGVSKTAWAYPDFIGYGYETCVACHYNGLGGGALNDYGRALFATEITARDVFPNSMTEEEIAAKSGFLGSTEIPWWFRPGLKYRGLWLKVNPGNNETIEKYINMQQDVNLNFFADKKQTVGLITTVSYADKYPPYTNVKDWQWYMKEYYLRWMFNKNLWLYAGQMDKAYGIRNADHEASNRSFNDTSMLSQFDQSLGAIVQFIYPTWDLAANIFFGNSYENNPEKQKGGSITGEYQVHEKFKIGASVLHSESDLMKWNLAAVTSRLGLTKGSSLLAEAGFKEQTIASKDPILGTYVWIESLVNIRRGYNLLTSVEASKSDIKTASPENLRWSLGAMIFPWPRTEFRFMAVNGKIYDDSSGQQDNWALQSQIHISY
ncbi:MAG TPA: hypothetical protein VN132_11275 [Bdellovibrio sp.]|nr:hypothetical protein [Bdellovibrio sp.]